MWRRTWRCRFLYWENTRWQPSDQKFMSFYFLFVVSFDWFWKQVSELNSRSVWTRFNGKTFVSLKTCTREGWGNYGRTSEVPSKFQDFFRASLRVRRNFVQKWFLRKEIVENNARFLTKSSIEVCTLQWFLSLCITNNGNLNLLRR